MTPVEERIDHERIREFIKGSWRGPDLEQRARALELFDALLTEHSARESLLRDCLDYFRQFDRERTDGITSPIIPRLEAALPAPKSAQEAERTDDPLDWHGGRSESEILIDNQPVRVARTTLTAQELRDLHDPPIRSDYEVWLEASSGDVRVGDYVAIVDGMRFYAAPRSITPGTEPAQPELSEQEEAVIEHMAPRSDFDPDVMKLAMSEEISYNIAAARLGKELKDRVAQPEEPDRYRITGNSMMAHEEPVAQPEEER